MRILSFVCKGRKGISMKKVLILQHASVNPPGVFGNMLERYHIPYDVLQAAQDSLPADLTDYRALVILGGQERVADEPERPYMTQEKRLIAYALKHQLPFLGICFGCQLLASTLHAEVTRCSPSRLGFVPITLTEAGRRDPLYQGLPDQQQAVQWHDDLVSLPKGAELLAIANGEEVQAFRVDKNVYGILYHIELTKDMLHDWLFDPGSKEEFIKKSSLEHYQKTSREYESFYPRYHEQTSTLIENFLSLNQLLPQNAPTSG
jgi:GMP synthase-like glutamine amidotransferase